VPIKILFIITRLELGGAQKNVLDIISSLEGSEFEAHLISSDGLLAQKARAILGPRLKIVSYLKCAPDPVSDILAVFSLVSYMKSNSIDIVHTHSSKAGIVGRLAAKLAGVRVVIHTVHGWGFHDHLRGFLNNFYIFLEKKAAEFTTRIVAVSESDIIKGLALKIGAEDKYVFIRCGIERALALISPNEILAKRRSLGLSSDDLVVGMVACFKPQKNPVDFVKCAALISDTYPEAKFLLIGDGVLRGRIERALEEKGLKDRVFLLGWRKDVGEILTLMDVFVLTSLWEGLPLALLEAIETGLPVAAYDICGIGEVVKDGVNGFLSRPGDVAGLSSKIKLLLLNQGLRKRMGNMGRYIISGEEFTLKNSMKRMQSIYRLEFKRRAG